MPLAFTKPQRALLSPLSPLFPLSSLLLSSAQPGGTLATSQCSGGASGPRPKASASACGTVAFDRTAASGTVNSVAPCAYLLCVLSFWESFFFAWCDWGAERTCDGAQGPKRGLVAPPGAPHLPVVGPKQRACQACFFFASQADVNGAPATRTSNGQAKRSARELPVERPSDRRTTLRGDANKTRQTFPREESVSKQNGALADGWAATSSPSAQRHKPPNEATNCARSSQGARPELPSRRCTGTAWAHCTCGVSRARTLRCSAYLTAPRVERQVAKIVEDRSDFSTWCHFRGFPGVEWLGGWAGTASAARPAP